MNKSGSRPYFPYSNMHFLVIVLFGFVLSICYHMSFLGWAGSLLYFIIYAIIFVIRLQLSSLLNCSDRKRRKKQHLDGQSDTSDLNLPEGVEDRERGGKSTSSQSKYALLEQVSEIFSVSQSQFRIFSESVFLGWSLACLILELDMQLKQVRSDISMLKHHKSQQAVSLLFTGMLLCLFYFIFVFIYIGASMPLLFFCVCFIALITGNLGCIYLI